MKRIEVPSGVGRWRSIVIALLIALGTLAGARAQNADAEALAAATEMFQIISADTLRQMTQQTTNAFWPAMQSKLREAKVDDATAAELRGEVERLVFQFVNKVMKDAPAMYARRFNTSELRQMIDFYRTPVGIKALRELPAIQGDVASLMVSVMPAMQAEIAGAVTAVLRKRGYGR